MFKIWNGDGYEGDPPDGWVADDETGLWWPPGWSRQRLKGALALGSSERPPVPKSGLIAGAGPTAAKPSGRVGMPAMAKPSSLAAFLELLGWGVAGLGLAGAAAGAAALADELGGAAFVWFLAAAVPSVLFGLIAVVVAQSHYRIADANRAIWEATREPDET